MGARSPSSRLASERYSGVAVTSPFAFFVSNLTTQPSGTSGTSVVPGANNVKGAWTELVRDVDVTSDCYELEVLVSAGALAATARNVLVDIGTGAAGAEVVLVPNLLAGPASVYVDTSEYPSGGVRFVFPLFVAAGTRIAARAQVSNAVAGTVRVGVTLRGAPTRPVWAGASVEAVGVDTATTSGVALVPGVAADGAWTSIGVLASAGKFIAFGVGSANAAVAAMAGVHVDVGVDSASPPTVVPVRQALFVVNTNEAVTKPVAGAAVDAAAGAEVYARARASAGPPTNISLAAYVVAA